MHLTNFLLLSCIVIACQPTIVICRPTTSASTPRDDKYTRSGREEVEVISDGKKDEKRTTDHSTAINTNSQGARVSRSTSAEFLPPTLKNRLHGRLSRFVDGVGAPRPLGVGSSASMYGSPLSKMISSTREAGSLGESETLNNEQVDPTFTPYISARVFNMPHFLESLRGNLESMTEEDIPSGEIEYDDDLASGGFQLQGDILAGGSDPQFINAETKGIQNWRPAAFIGSRPRNRNMFHFVHQPSVLEGRNAYEFGLG